jgi:hypothetical protein
MEKKKAILDALPDAGPADDRYRYLSNLGTFHLIRWITTDESVRSVNPDDLKASETHIAKALELNPDAHFGREKYQLMLIQCLLARSDQFEEHRGTANFLNLDATLMLNPSSGSSPPAELEAAREGVTGLIQLGAAWQSIDTFRALQVCLHSQRSASLAHLAYLRQLELADAGAISLHPDEAVREAMKPEGYPSSFHGADAVERFYKDARSAADKRDKAWLAYQEERFAQGMHPDTHPDFWYEWKEPAFPKLPGPTLKEYIRRHLLLSLTAFVIFLCFLLSLPKLLRRRKRTIEAPATATA